MGHPAGMLRRTMIVSVLATCVETIRLSTRSIVPLQPRELHDFLATPANWPRIVLSSQAVAGECNLDVPAVPGAQVDEIFGAPPVLPLRVRWICAYADREGGRLSFQSEEGVAGVARMCRMDFSIAEEGTSGSSVELTMSYEPESPLAIAATPFLVLDNMLALKFLLPRVASSSSSRLGTQDPIAGPLVAAARSIGVLPAEEADGWKGEPSAWAEADSFTQKLSELSQERLSGFKQWAAERVAGDFDKEVIDRRLDETIGANAVVVFSFTSCPFCKKAKELLDAKAATYAVVELDEDSDGAAMRARLGARTGRTSVPSVWIGGEYLGGLNDGPGIAPLDAEGLLQEKLRRVGAVPTAAP